MNSVIKAYEEINKVKSVIGGNISLEKVMEDMNNVKILNTYTDICNGVKTSNAMSSNKLNKNIIKNFCGVNSLYFASKGNVEYKAKTSNKPNPNKGKKMVRDGEKCYYISKADYNELVEAGKVKGKSVEKSKKKKSVNIRGGAILSSDVGDLVNGLNVTNTNVNNVSERPIKASEKYRNI